MRTDSDDLPGETQFYGGTRSTLANLKSGARVEVKRPQQHRAIGAVRIHAQK